jgi:hypothetical protein
MGKRLVGKPVAADLWGVDANQPELRPAGKDERVAVDDLDHTRRFRRAWGVAITAERDRQPG